MAVINVFCMFTTDQIAKMPPILCVSASIWVAGANERLESASRVDGLGINMMAASDDETFSMIVALWFWHQVTWNEFVTMRWSRRADNNNNKGHARERECGFHASLYQKTNNVILSRWIIFIYYIVYVWWILFLSQDAPSPFFPFSGIGHYQIGVCVLITRQKRILFFLMNEIKTRNQTDH